MKGKYFLWGLLFFVCIIMWQTYSFPRTNSGQMIWQLSTYRDYWGPVQRGTVNSKGEVVHLATPATLYEVKKGKVKTLAERPEEDARLALAPGGGVYAWLIPQPTRQGLFFVRLMHISGRKIADLMLKEFPYGFGSLYFGFQGKLIVTVSPLDGWQGLGGRFQYSFWDRQGRLLKNIVLKGIGSGTLDARGDAILILGEREATAFSNSGNEIWRHKGKFRKAAIARSGKFALLNPASQKHINQVHILNGSGEATVVTIPTPVHKLVINPDTLLGIVIGDKGRYFYLDPKTADLKEGPKLPLIDTFYIFDAEFIDTKVLALGILHRVGEPPKENWPKGTIIIIDLDGKIVFQKDFSIQMATSSVPSIDITYGSQFLLGFTNETTILVDLGK